jgi:SAM-dependent methyltransferase
MFSQINQDTFVDRLLKKDRGFFLDIGAGTGGIKGQHISFYSNTYYLEEYRDWSGIAIDYDQEYIDLAIKQRSHCACVCADLLKTNINAILKENNCPEIVDYLSLDVDDATEKVFDELDFNKYAFRVITFEHNLFQAITSVQNHTPEHKSKVMQFHSYSREKFKKLGYKLLHADVVLDDYGPVEDWYIEPDLIYNGESMKTTTFKNYKDIF